MSYGFIYVLANRAMPGIYKVGFTERSPSLRCEELSSATGVPAPFELVCYAEYMNAQEREREIHRELAGFLVSRGREFFKCDLFHITQMVMDEELACTLCDRDMVTPMLYAFSPMFKARIDVSDFIQKDSLDFLTNGKPMGFADESQSEPESNHSLGLI